jgi:hypothetical protein
MERRGKSTMRRVQLEEGLSPRGSSLIERGGERAPHEECSYKEAWSPRFSPIGRRRKSIK